MEVLNTKPVLDTLFDLSLDLLCLLNREGCILKVNKYLAGLLGYPEEDLLHKHFFEFVQPNEQENVTRQWQFLAENEAAFSFTTCHQYLNGQHKFFSWNVVKLTNKTFYASVRDVSQLEAGRNELTKAISDNQKIYKQSQNIINALNAETKNQKEQFGLNERRLEALIQSGNDLVGILDANGTYKYISPSVAHVLNIGPQNFIGKLPYEFVHPDDCERIKNAFKYILTTDELVHVSPFRVKDGDGKWRWLETFATNLLNDPAIAGVVVNSRDISIKIKDEEEKRLAAEQLRRSIERYKLVTEVTKDVIWDWNLETNQLSRDPGFEKHFGYDDLSSTSSNPWEAYIHPADRERILNSLLLAIDNPDEKFWMEEYRFIKADGTVAFIVDKGYVVRNSDKKVIRMVGAMHDNTELKEKELHILKQNQTLREISQINSHVIRKPVATILGLMQIIDRKAIQGTPNQEILECLDITTNELDMVIRHINDMSVE